MCRQVTNTGAAGVLHHSYDNALALGFTPIFMLQSSWWLRAQGSVIYGPRVRESGAYHVIVAEYGGALALGFAPLLMLPRSLLVACGLPDGQPLWD